MVQQVETNAKALLVFVDKKNPHDRWYRCNMCHDMFKPIIHYEKWDSYYCIPKLCPHCGELFKNGMKEIDSD